MNRQQRRNETRGTPAKFRGVPVVSITREDMARHFPPSTRDGDVITMKGYAYETRNGKRVIVRCEPGKEKPFKLELRAATALDTAAEADDVVIVDRPGRAPICRITADALAKVPGMTRDGEYATFAGVRWRRGKLEDCAPGQEKPFKLEIRI